MTSLLSRLAISLTLFVTPPALAAAPNASSLLFESPALTDLPTGTRLLYDLERIAPEPAGSPTPSELGVGGPSRGEIELSILPAEEAGARQVRVQVTSEGRQRLAGPFPGLVANPVLLVFLERDVAQMAGILRGSPYYLRNRIREALGETVIAEPARLAFEGREVEGWRVTASPFETDRNREKMREFATKRYEFTLSDAVPGRVLDVSAVTRAADGSLLAQERLVFRRALEPGQEAAR